MPELVQQTLSSLAILGGAFVLAVPVGWDRERHERSMGLRTFPLVAMGSAGWVLVAQAIAPDDPGGQARIVQGLITGIGFLGGGAILKNDNRVRGTATAAAIWTTALVGAAVAYGLYEIAVATSLVTFAALSLLKPVKQQIEDEANDLEDPDEAASRN